MRSYWEIIGQAIREARQEIEESQRNTALRLGIKPSDYCNMEDGEDNPDMILDALMRALRERDEALEALAAEIKHHTETTAKWNGHHMDLTIAQCDLNKALRERDEAWEKLHRVLKLLDDYDEAVKNPSSPFLAAFKKLFTWGGGK